VSLFAEDSAPYVKCEGCGRSEQALPDRAPGLSLIAKLDRAKEEVARRGWFEVGMAPSTHLCPACVAKVLAWARR
jgi:hypothetical protein